MEIMMLLRSEWFHDISKLLLSQRANGNHMVTLSQFREPKTLFPQSNHSQPQDHPHLYTAFFLFIGKETNDLPHSYIEI